MFQLISRILGSIGRGTKGLARGAAAATKAVVVDRAIDAVFDRDKKESERVIGGAAAKVGRIDFSQFGTTSSKTSDDDARALLKFSDTILQQTDSLLSNEESVQNSNIVNTTNVIITNDDQPTSNFAKYVTNETNIIQKVHEEKNISRSDNSRSEAMAKTINAIHTASMNLNDDAKESIKNIRSENLNKARENQEKRLEGNSINDTLRKAFEKVSSQVSSRGAQIKNAISPFLLPATLLATPTILDVIDNMLPGDGLDPVLENVDNVFDTATQAAGVPKVTASIKDTVETLDSLSRVQSGGSMFEYSNEYKSKTGAGPVSAREQNKVMKNLKRFQDSMKKLAESGPSVKADLAKWALNLPPRISAWFTKHINALSKKILKFYAVVEGIKFMITMYQAYVSGSISEDEMHRRNKKQLTDILRLFSGPLIVMLIFKMAGASVGAVIGTAGTPVGSVIVGALGALGGGLLGLIVGIIFGDAVFNILKLDKVVSAIYDIAIFGIKAVGFVYDLVKIVLANLPHQLAVNATIATVNYVRDTFTDRIATDEEIMKEYGKDIGSSELLFKAGEGIGTDENAILYAFKDVDTPEKYKSLKKDFEEKYLPEYNKGFGRDVDTMEEYLQKELNDDEYQLLKNQIRTQMKQNSDNDTEELKSFLRQTGIEKPTIIGIGEVTDEEYAKYQAGELIDVVTMDGKKVLMTHEELRKSDNVAAGLKRPAMEKARRRKLRNEESNVQPTDDSEVPERAQEVKEDTQATNDIVEDVANRAGISPNENNGYTSTLFAGVPVVINGQPVPEEVYTEVEKHRIKVGYVAAERVFADFSDETFWRNDPESYREYKDYYNQERRRLFDEKLNELPEEARKQEVFRDSASLEAERGARRAALFKFREQIIKAGAGTLATEPIEPPQQPERPAEGSQEQITPQRSQTEPLPVRNQAAVSEIGNNINQNLIPGMSKMMSNLNVLNTIAVDNQKQKALPAGTEGPSVATSATPSRKTNDSFLDIAYVT